MRKINWENVRDIIPVICLAVIIGLAPCSGLFILISLHDNYPPIKWLGIGGLGITVFSIVIGCITSLIDFVCRHKKRKKIKYVQPIMIIEESIVV